MEDLKNRIVQRISVVQPIQRISKRGRRSGVRGIPIEFPEVWTLEDSSSVIGASLHVELEKRQKDHVLAARTFLPRILQQFPCTGGESDRTVLYRCRGCVVFSDASGFTKLTETLAQRADGAEVLSKCLNKFFTPLIDIIESYRGDVIKFSGDALSILFEATDDYELMQCPCGSADAKRKTPFQLACLRASACCLEIHKRLHNFDTGEGGVRLTLHIGVGAGDVTILQIGGEHGRFEYVIAGTPMEQITIAEPLAGSGETVLSPQTWREIHWTVQEGEPLTEGPPGFHRLRGLDTDQHTYPTIKAAAIECTRIQESRKTALEDSALLALSERFIPRAVLKNMRSGNSSHINEMRSVTIVFVQIQGVDVSTDHGSRVAQDLMLAMQRTCYMHEGNLNKFLVDDKGILVLFVFGLPPLVHIDDPARATAASFDMINVLSEMSLRGRFGITTGRVYCGIVGSDRRREYTVMGDTVNLSARLMANAPDNSVLVDEATYLRSNQEVNLKRLAPIKVKGKSGSIQVFAPDSPAVHGVVLPALRPHLNQRCWGKDSTNIDVRLRGTGTRLISVRMPWRARSPALGGSSPLLRLTRWRELHRLSQQLEGPSGLLVRGGSLVLLGRSGIGKLELGESVISSGLKAGLMPLFGSMRSRAEDRVRCCAELIQSCIVALCHDGVDKDLSIACMPILSEIVGNDPRLFDALAHLGFEVDDAPPKREKSLSKLQRRALDEGMVEIAAQLVLRVSAAQGVMVVLRLSKGTDIYDGLRASGCDASLFWMLCERLNQLAVGREANIARSASPTRANPVLLVVVARKFPDTTMSEYEGMSKVAPGLLFHRQLHEASFGPGQSSAQAFSDHTDEDAYRPWVLKMDPLTEDAAVELMCHCLSLPTTNGGVLVKRSLRDFIIAVSINIPVYIQECIQQMVSVGCVKVVDGELVLVQELRTVNIAEWVQTSMVGGTISQLESLGSAKMHIMKLATVFEGPFSPLDLAAANRILFGNVPRYLAFYNQAKLLKTCEELVKHGFLERFKSEGAPADRAPVRLPRWTLSNALFRRVAGSMLLNSQKLLIKRAVLIERALNVELPQRLRVAGQQSARRKSAGSDTVAGSPFERDESPLDTVNPGTDPDRLQDVLVVACSLGTSRVVEDILNLKHDAIDINKAVDATGSMPLHFACSSGEMEVVQLLCERQASVNAKNASMETPLMVAAQRGYLHIVQYLCDSHEALASTAAAEMESWENSLHSIGAEADLPTALFPTFQAGVVGEQLIGRRAQIQSWLKKRFSGEENHGDETIDMETNSMAARHSRRYDRSAFPDPTLDNVVSSPMKPSASRKKREDSVRWKHELRNKVRVWLHSRAVLIFMLINLAVALYTPDVMVAIGVPGNFANDFVLTVAGFLFAIEIILLSSCDYSYLWSFFFYMDCIGTASLIFDLSYMLADSANEPQTDTGGSQNLTFFRASRTAKIGARAGRLSRLVKLMKFLTRSKDGEGPEELKHISNQLTNVLSKRVASLTICMVIFMPFFSFGLYPTGDFSMQVWTETLYKRARQNATVAGSPSLTSLLTSFSDFYTYEPYGPFKVCFDAANGAPNYFAGCHALSSPFIEPMRRSFQLDVSQGFVVASFDYSEPTKAEARVGLVMITSVVLLMCLACVLLNHAAAEMAVRPLQRMLMSIKGSAQQIFSTVSVVEAAGENDGFADFMQGEVALLERVVKKIATLAELSRKNLFDEQALNNMQGEDLGVLHLAGATNIDGKKKSSQNSIRAAAVTPTMHWQLDEIGISFDLVNSWDFNVLVMDRRLHLRMSYWLLMNNPGSCAYSEQHVDSQIMEAFIKEVSEGYLDNPYHNFLHAVDVTHGVFRYMNLVQAELIFPAIELYAILVASISHDLGHVGFNNVFLVETQHELAIRYNDRSPLENLHCCKLFELLSDARWNVFSDISAEDYRRVRKMIIMVILHTDLTQHAAMVKELELLFEMHVKVFEITSPSLTQQQIDVLCQPENKSLTAKTLLHAADTSNPTKPWEIGKAWAWRVLEEYAAQGDREKHLGLPVGMLNDRDKVNRPSSQIGFIEFIITPLIAAEVKIFRAWHQVSVLLEDNLLQWEELWIDECNPSAPEREKVKDRVKKMSQKLDNKRFKDSDSRMPSRI